ncbi:hypothetical protein [Streptomyces sp. JV184]|uniref:hypothetical protein n=1 Tax=Streptomyces sp. JV184 TaxID=858637 RepID=UPI002E79D105|nr:hypothetical protein [Streptomyces sp. JV184]MEE1745197.1 hypothetical protein [Streptomyces sp. JV184]
MSKYDFTQGLREVQLSRFTRPVLPTSGTARTCHGRPNRCPAGGEKQIHSLCRSAQPDRCPDRDPLAAPAGTDYARSPSPTTAVASTTCDEEYNVHRGDSEWSIARLSDGQKLSDGSTLYDTQEILSTHLKTVHPRRLADRILRVMAPDHARPPSEAGDRPESDVGEQRTVGKVRDSMAATWDPASPQ